MGYSIPRATLVLGLASAGIASLALAGMGGRAAAAPRATAAAEQKNAKEIRASLERMAEAMMKKHNYPAIGVAYAEGDKFVEKRGFGIANGISNKEPVESTVCALGFGSQVLTGVEVMTLVDQGKLTLSDPLGKFIPDAPEDWRAVTVEQFLRHSSGIPQIPWNAGTFDEAIKVAGQNDMRFDPGTEVNVKDSSYDVLGKIVERVTGEAFVASLRSQVSKALKMDNTGDLTMYMKRATITESNSNDLPNLTRDASTGPMTSETMRDPAYMAKLAKMREVLSKEVPEFEIPNQGLASTYGDLLKLMSRLMDSKMFQPATMESYWKINPGWITCKAGSETILVATGRIPSNSGAMLQLAPARKASLFLVWDLNGKSDDQSIAEESQAMMEAALGLAKSTWSCQ